MSINENKIIEILERHNEKITTATTLSVISAVAALACLFKVLFLN